MTDRQFDLVLFGATGFTGGLVADYLATAAPADLRIPAVLFALTRIHVPRIERPVVVGRPQVLRNFGSAIAYVRRVRFTTDCKILLHTIPALLGRRTGF